MTVRLGIAAAVTGLVGAGTIAASASTHHATAKVPSLQAVVKDGKLSVTGDRSVPAGRVKLSLTAKGNEYAVEMIRFDKGYSFKDFRADLAAFGQSFGPNGPTKSGIKHLDHALANGTAYGGFDTADGTSEHGMLLLDKPGTYYLYNDSGNLPKQKQKITVTAPAGKQKLPATDGTVKTKDGARFGGDSVLPAKGNITFKNVATDSPHILILQHVKEGTTKKQVENALQSNDAPSWLRRGQVAADAVSPGHAMNVHVHVPAGEYVEMCFFPDPKTGMPHAFMGMVRIVHLK